MSNSKTKSLIRGLVMHMGTEDKKWLKNDRSTFTRLPVYFCNELKIPKREIFHVYN